MNVAVIHCTLLLLTFLTVTEYIMNRCFSCQHFCSTWLFVTCHGLVKRLVPIIIDVWDSRVKSFTLHVAIWRSRPYDWLVKAPTLNVAEQNGRPDGDFRQRLWLTRSTLLCGRCYRGQVFKRMCRCDTTPRHNSKGANG